MKRKYEDISERVGQIQAKRASAAKSASETPNATDPTEQGTVTPPNHPDGDSAAKKNLPEGTANTKGDVNLPEGTTTQPSGHGENVPGDVSSGDAKDKAATKPNDPLSKIAGVMERIDALRSGKKTASTKEAGETKPTKEAGETKPTKEEADKKAGESQGAELSYEVRCKLANEICATEEGRQQAEQILKKAHGREAAAELIKAAHEEYGNHLQALSEQDEFEKQAAYQQHALEEHFASLTKNASEEDMQKITKFAEVHSAAINALEYDFEKQAYLKAAMDAAMMEDAMAGGAAPEEAMIPEGGEEPLSPDAILALLEELVASGQMDEATATALAAELLGEGGGAMTEEGAMPPEGVMPEEGAMPEEIKAASAILKEIEEENK